MDSNAQLRFVKYEYEVSIVLRLNCKKEELLC